MIWDGCVITLISSRVYYQGDHNARFDCIGISCVQLLYGECSRRPQNGQTHLCFYMFIPATDFTNGNAFKQRWICYCYWPVYTLVMEL